MEKYWITFRLKENLTYRVRYNNMLSNLIAVRGAQWGEPSSFWLVETSLDIDALMRTLTAPLDSKTDLVVVRRLKHDQSRFFGTLEHLDLLQEFLPNIRRSG